MRHRTGYRKLNLATDQRMALLKGLCRALFLHQRIETTVMRAKEAQKMVDHIITFAKTGTLAARREAAKLIPDRTLLKVIFDSAPRYANRQGGYTRATVIGHRRGDAVKVVALELIQDEPTESAK